jgi:hypothetical protein
MDEDISPADMNMMQEFLGALVEVKRALYQQFLDDTEESHEQNVDIITRDYPAYLARWSTELCKGPANLPPPAAKVDARLLSALGGLKAVMEKADAEGSLGKTTCDYYVKALFVTYPYAMNTNSLS